MSTQNLLYTRISVLWDYTMYAEKNKGADQSAQLNSWSALLFFSKSNHRFHSSSHDATFTVPCILKYVKIVLHLQLIFNAWTVIVVLLCFGLLQYWYDPLFTPGHVRPICSGLAISIIHDNSFISDTKSINQLICTGWFVSIRCLETSKKIPHNSVIMFS